MVLSKRLLEILHIYVKNQFQPFNQTEKAINHDASGIIFRLNLRIEEKVLNDIGRKPKDFAKSCIGSGSVLQGRLISKS